MSDGCASIQVCGEVFLGDPSGALFWPREGLLIASDLHFEKGSSFAVKGQMLPPYDTRATLAALSKAIATHRPEHVLALGDSFHDEEAGGRLASEDMDSIRALTAAVAWTWITGNHDEVLPQGIGGRVVGEVTLGPLTLRHEPCPGEDLDDEKGELAGHLHPAAVVRTRSRHLRRRCFVGDGRRLILPAFGAFTGGLNINDGAFDGLFECPPTAWVLGRGRVYTIPPARLSRNG